MGLILSSKFREYRNILKEGRNYEKDNYNKKCMNSKYSIFKKDMMNASIICDFVFFIYIFIP